MRTLWILVVGVCLLCSCTLPPASLPSPEGADRPAQALPDFEFVAELSRRESVTLAEALRLVSLSLEDGGDFDAPTWREAALEVGWISDDLELEDTLTYGRAGRFIAGLCDLKENFFLRVFGPSERYGLRECQRLSYLDVSYSDQSLAGSVLMTALSQADASMAKDGKSGPDSGRSRFLEHLRQARESGKGNPP